MAVVAACCALHSGAWGVILGVWPDRQVRLPKNRIVHWFNQSKCDNWITSRRSGYMSIFAMASIGTVHGSQTWWVMLVCWCAELLLQAISQNTKNIFWQFPTPVSAQWYDPLLSKHAKEITPSQDVRNQCQSATAISLRVWLLSWSNCFEQVSQWNAKNARPAPPKGHQLHLHFYTHIYPENIHGTFKNDDDIEWYRTKPPVSFKHAILAASSCVQASPLRRLNYSAAHLHYTSIH